TINKIFKFSFLLFVFKHIIKCKSRGLSIRFLETTTNRKVVMVNRLERMHFTSFEEIKPNFDKKLVAEFEGTKKRSIPERIKSHFGSSKVVNNQVIVKLKNDFKLLNEFFKGTKAINKEEMNTLLDGIDH